MNAKEFEKYWSGLNPYKRNKPTDYDAKKMEAYHNHRVGVWIDKCYNSQILHDYKDGKIDFKVLSNRLKEQLL